MSEQDCGQLTLYPVDSPASPFPWLESKKGKTMTVTSGLRCSGLSESCVVGENVPGILKIAAGQVVEDLERAGYRVVVFHYEAAAVGAWHRRSRLFFAGLADMADTDGEGLQGGEQHGASAASEDTRERPSRPPAGERRETVRNTLRGGRDRIGRRRQRQEFADGRCWAAEPELDRVAYGIPHRVDRLKCLGNAVVPQQAYPIFKALAEELKRSVERLRKAGLL